MKNVTWPWYCVWLGHFILSGGGNFLSSSTTTTYISGRECELSWSCRLLTCYLCSLQSKCKPFFGSSYLSCCGASNTPILYPPAPTSFHDPLQPPRWFTTWKLCPIQWQVQSRSITVPLLAATNRLRGRNTCCGTKRSTIRWTCISVKYVGRSSIGSKLQLYFVPSTVARWA